MGEGQKKDGGGGGVGERWMDGGRDGADEGDGGEVRRGWDYGMRGDGDWNGDWNGDAGVGMEGGRVQEGG